ncbi:MULTISPECIES: PAC2 family protein [unclassified Janibacter]|uniref:PAC2 family protein n=1 Tax=unclassified Janibacter TaxID=2649294 RepID=UPI003D03780B
MQNPTELFRFEVDTDLETPAPGTLLVAFDGFMDAGGAQRLLVRHLLETAEDATVVASFDIDALLDYRGRRPAMTFEATAWTSYEDPALLLYRLRDRDGQTYYLLTGPEPDFQWERVIEAIRLIIGQLGVTLTVSTHGIPMAVPHTRPVGMTVHATDTRLVGERNPVFGKVAVPASLSALLELRLGEAGQDAVGFAIHVPHYLAQAEFHDAALTALNAIVDVSGLNLPNDDLVAAAGSNRLEIEREVRDNPEVGEAVAALERQYDVHLRGLERPNLLAAEGSELPSADELGAEFEDFLRTVSDDGDA